MLTFSRQTLAAAKDAERSRVLEEQVRLRTRLRELEDAVARIERRAAAAEDAKGTWSKAYYNLLAKYNTLCSSGGSSLPFKPASADGAPASPSLRGCTPSSDTTSS